MQILGAQLPRLESVPPYVKSEAPDAIALGEQCGLYLDPWQKYVMTGSLGKDRRGLWSAFEVLLIVSRQNGKGSILEVRELAGLFLFPTDRLIIHTAHEHKTSSEHYLRVWNLIDGNPSLRRMVARHSSAYGREFIETRERPTIIAGAGGKWVRASKSHRLVFIARSGGSGRGFTGDCIVYDEDMILDAAKVGASLPVLLARPNPQVIYAGSAGLKTSTQLALIRRRAIAAAESGRSDSLAYYEWSIDPHNEYCPVDCTRHDDPGTDQSIAKANPGLGIRLSVEKVRKLSAGMTEDARLREIYGVGQYPAPLDGWLIIPKTWYQSTRDTSETPPRVTQPVFAIECALDHSSAAIAVAGKRPDERVGIQVVEHHEGTGWIVKTALGIDKRWHPSRWVIDKRSAAGSVIADLQRAGLPLELMQAQDVANASGQLFDAFRDDTIRHYDQENVKIALAAADWRKLSESRAIDRIAAVDTTPLMAVTFAHWGYLRFGMDADYDVSDSVHFDVDEIIRIYRAGVYGPHDIRRLIDEGLLGEKDLGALADAGIPF